MIRNDRRFLLETVYDLAVKLNYRVYAAAQLLRYRDLSTRDHTVATGTLMSAAVLGDFAQSALNSRPDYALICLSCGAPQSSDGTLPCDH